ncbi:hypothetical protein EJB05_01717 [Eragrostis curvula]|uniref:Uncharacterized protein n=1 Tax=Eragrostis curvula TaxID=38414 RepID=A0A5J9WQD9_9POAL|nr:hypothetical protein EJB05_01717 [Eragrostis curvula]
MPRHGASGRATSAAAESAGAGGKAAPAAARTNKRVALGNVTNVAGAGRRGRRAGGSVKVARASANTAILNSASSAETVKQGMASALFVSSARGPAVPPHENAIEKQDVHPLKNRTIVHVSNVKPASERPGGSPRLAPLQLQANEHLCVIEASDGEETKCMANAPVAMEIDQVCDASNNKEDPQLCPYRTSDIYMFLREDETKKRPSSDFMETIQKDVNSKMRAILIDWLVEVADEYRLVPDTLYLAVNYIDRYLSGNKVKRQRKHEEICAPQVEEFCYITDNTYFRYEVRDMESSVLNHLKYEMNAPTTKCFLRRIVSTAQSFDEDESMNLELLANYVAELSLLEYNLLSYRPSLIASSAVFLAKFILQPTKKPWNFALARYTRYKPSELCDCVKELHRLFSVDPGVKLQAIREKYSQYKYKFVAKRHCPPSIPAEFFLDEAC